MFSYTQPNHMRRGRWRRILLNLLRLTVKWRIGPSINIERLRATHAHLDRHVSGVEVRVEIWKRMRHVFQAGTGLPQSGAATRNIRELISNHTSWGVTEFCNGWQ